MRKIFKRLMWHAAPYIALPILLIGVPLGEFWRAWQNMHIRSQYRYNLTIWRRERAKPFPEAES